MCEEIKVGSTVQIHGEGKRGTVLAIDGEEAWVLFEGNRGHTTALLATLRLCLEYEEGDRVSSFYGPAVIIGTHIAHDGRRWYWVEYESSNNCWGIPKDEHSLQLLSKARCCK